MKMCYVDESGDTGPFDPQERNSQPIFLLCGLLMDTWNFSSHGSAYHYMAELPLFGHSENHAMLQLSDWIGSAFLAPMASSAYCSAYTGQCVHVVPQFDEIRSRFGQRIKHLQYRFERDGKKLGGIHVLGGKETRLNPLLMFGDSNAVQS